MARRFLAPAASLVAGLVFLAACTDAPSDTSPDDAGEAPAASGAPSRAARIVDSARAAAGAEVLSQGAVVSFGFRGERFRLRREKSGAFSYTRAYRDTLGRNLVDVLTSDTLRRRVEGRPAALYLEEERRSARTALNSVAYFALLPFPLGDPAVQPSYAGADTVGGVPYHRVAVRFRQAGGGRDWQDRFVYWFDRRDFSMDYLAYAYGLGPDEEDYGTRFREAFNVRRVAGVRFADYRNYTTRTDSLAPDALARYGRLFDADSLRLVSTVALDSVQVRPLD